MSPLTAKVKCPHYARLLTRKRLITTLKEVVAKSKNIFQESAFFREDKARELDGPQIASNLIYELITNTRDTKRV